MFLKSISLLANLAVEITALQYPKEFKNPYYAKEIFDVVELVGDDLVKRNVSLFTDQYINQLVDIKDMRYGDTVDFVVSEERTKYVSL